MDQRVEYLEGEMARYAESLEVISQQFNLMQHFIQIQFGSKFEKFYESQQAKNSASEPNGSFETTEDYDEQDDESALKGDMEVYDDEDDNDLDLYGEDEEEDENGVACPSEMVAVQFEEEAEDVANDRRRPARNESGKNLRNLAEPKASAPQIQKQATQSVTPRVTRPPPPLLRRPPVLASNTAVSTVSSTIRQNLNLRLQRPNASSSGGLRINHDELHGTGNGKYAKYYRKVDAELIQCKICSKILKRRGKFIQHLRTHTGEKPFCCEFCGASFSRKDNMNVHLARHHSGPNPHALSKSISCQLCRGQFWNQAEFNAHLQLVHGYTAAEEHGEDNDYDEDQGESVDYGDEDEDDEGLVFNA